MNLKKILIILIFLSITTVKAKTEINDSIFATVGNKVITRSDIVNEIKIVLISTGQTFTEEKLKVLQTVAVKALIERNIKKLEISKYENLPFNQEDLYDEINKLAQSINVDIDTLQNTLISNGVRYETLTDLYKTELLWNTLIFQLYKNNMTVNKEEVEEQLASVQNKKEILEYLISEIVIAHINKTDRDAEIEKIKSSIKKDGFENVAMKLSISESSLDGGNIGWISEYALPKDLKSAIEGIQIGEVSDAIILQEGILFFKLRDKRKVENIIDLEIIKNQIIKREKLKILNMHSLSHYDKLRRTITIKYY